MSASALLRDRLRQQQLWSPRFTRPDLVVARLGGVQAQDYTAAKWAIGQRLVNGTDDGVERAFAEGSLLRTHVMRPTWHFVTPADIRWMIALTAPRLRKIMAYYLRQHGLDGKMVRRSLAAIERALRDGRHLTRPELAAALTRARAAPKERLASDHVMGHILGWAEIEALVCSGPRHGKQFTYALLEERVPPSAPLSREEALAELTRRYFRSHGPALLQDFAWWSGLTLGDARLGIQLARRSLARQEHRGLEHWKAARLPPLRGAPPRAHLLPNFDEYIVAYADRSALMDDAVGGRFRTRSSVLFGHTVILEGRIAGTWRRTYARNAVAVSLQLLRTPGREERDAIEGALERFAQFVAPLSVRVDWAPRERSR